MFNKQDNIYTGIFSDILSQKYPPNTVLKERDLAIKYRTSRTTVRQILQKLSHEDKIIINPRSKTIVKKINLERIEQSFLLRHCLELTVASIILKKIQAQDLDYLLENLKEQYNYYVPEILYLCKSKKIYGKKNKTSIKSIFESSDYPKVKK